jgi:hypothetical protein
MAAGLHQEGKQFHDVVFASPLRNWCGMKRHGKTPKAAVPPLAWAC